VDQAPTPPPDPGPASGPSPGAGTWEQVRHAGVKAWNAGQWQEAERALLDALARAQRGEQLPEGRDSSRLLVQSLLDLGCFYADHGSPPVADRLLVRALKLVDADPALGRNSPAAAQVCMKLADLRCRPRGLDSAEPLARRSLDIHRRHKQYGPDHPHTARAISTLARVLVKRGRLDDAEALFLEALGIFQRHPPAPQHDACWVLHNLGDIYLARSDQDKALETHLAALEARQAVLPPDHEDVLDSLRRVAACYVRLDRCDRALPLYQQVADARERKSRHDLPYGQALYDLGVACARLDPRRSAELLEQALAIQEKHLGPDHPGLAGTLVKLAEVLAALQQWDRVVRLRKRIVPLREKELGEGHPQVINAVTHVCHACCRAERWEEAEALDERALFLCEKHLGFEHPKVAAVLTHFAEVLRHRGHEARAMRAAERAEQINRKHPGESGTRPRNDKGERGEGGETADDQP